jgi:hypothetical protein
MGDLFKGVHLLTQTEYDSLAANEKLDPDVLYATPENVTELVRQHTEQISENSTNIARNKEDIESLKKSPGGSSEDIVEIKNTINEIILRDTAQDTRLDDIKTAIDGMGTAIQYVDEERIKNKNITWFYDYVGELTGSEPITVGNNIRLELVYGAHSLSFDYDSDTTELTLGRPYYDAYTLFKLSNLKPNTEYTLSFNLVSSVKTNYGYVFGIFLQTNTTTGVRYSKTITTDENGEYNSSGVENSIWFSAEGDSATISQFQLEEGRYSTEYTRPYGVVLRARANRVKPGVTNSFQNDAVVEYWVSSDGLTWYRKWSSGWKECGTTTSVGSVSGGNQVKKDITLPIAFTKILSSQAHSIVGDGTGETAILATTGKFVYGTSTTTVSIWARNILSASASGIVVEVYYCGY